MFLSLKKLLSVNDVSISKDTAERIHLRDRPLPTAPDGRYDYEVLASGETDGKEEAHSRLYYLMNKVKEVVDRGLPVTDPSAPVRVFS